MKMKQELGVLGAAAQCNYLQNICSNVALAGLFRFFPDFITTY